MMISISVDGDRAMAARLGAMPKAVHAALELEIRRLALLLQRNVKVNHLSGPTGAHSLSVGKNTRGHTGGQLRASVFERVDVGVNGVVGSVGYSADVPYAAIHEFGGTVHIPEIVPVKAKALHWMSGGKSVFAMRVKAHSVVMPERAPLRTAFSEMAGPIRAGLKSAITEGLRRAE